MTELSELIASLPRERRNLRLQGLRGVFRFQIEGVGTYHMRVEEGETEMVEWEGEATTTFTCSDQDFRDVFLGTKNLITAILQGRIDVQGDLAQSFLFHKLLKIRQVERERVEEEGGAP